MVFMANLHVMRALEWTRGGAVMVCREVRPPSAVNDVKNDSFKSSAP
ncbi:MULTISPECIES: hypothetical protein [unclassified Bradyrhizobium]|nr:MULTISPECIES: hypothetical protein [unclassified Bradyrhizobium]